MAKKPLKMVQLFINILFLLFVILFLYVFITIYRGGVPKFFGYSFLRVISSSMEPVISQGDLIIAKEAEGEDIGKGDIITFYSRDPYLKGLLNTHRVVDVIPRGEESGEREYVTKGDANAREDYYNAWQSDLIGKYRAKLPGGRLLVRMIYTMQNKLLYFCVMVFPILVCFFYSLYSVVRILIDSQEEMDDENEE